MSRRFKVESVKVGTLLEVRIKKGSNIVKQESLVKGFIATGSVSPGESLQVRERNLRTGKATPWETIIKGGTAPARKKKKPKKKPAKKKTKKSTPKKKAKKKGKKKKPAKKKPKKKPKKKTKKKAKKKNPCPPKRKKK